MPETARILRFPGRVRHQAISPAEALDHAQRILAGESDPAAAEGTILSNAEVLFAVCKLLRDRVDSKPSQVAEVAKSLFPRLMMAQTQIGLFDERDYLCGEIAFLAAAAFRLLGNREESARWLNRAEASFRHTVNPAPKLADVAYLRLALIYDARQFQDVIEMTPSLAKSFAKLEMPKEFLKTLFLEAMALKASGEPTALRAFRSLSEALDPDRDSRLLGQVLVELGAFEAIEGRYQEALSQYNAALGLFKTGDHPMFVAHLKATVAETLRLKGELTQAIAAYRDAISDYADLEMEVQVAYLRVILAEALLENGSAREAEWEILAALPKIEERRMVPEGFMAVALLKESVHRRRTDPNALRDLREQLRAGS